MIFSIHKYLTAVRFSLNNEILKMTSAWSFKSCFFRYFEKKNVITHFENSYENGDGDRYSKVAGLQPILY